VLGFLAPRRAAAASGDPRQRGGTTSRAYEEFFPRTRVDGVEIDPELSEIGRRYFDMNNPRLHLYHEDARPFMRRIDARYDVSRSTPTASPTSLLPDDQEFFESVRDRLAPGGVVLMNVGHPEGQDGLEKVLSATVGEVFAHVLRDPIRTPTPC
jgi:spermidine synthase